MKVATYRGEKKLSDLVARIYRIRGPAASKKGEELAVALLSANPHLKELNKVAEGTLIIVPDVAGVQAREAKPRAENISAEIAAQLRAQLTNMQRQIDEAAAQEAQEVTNTLEVLKEKELKSAARMDPAINLRSTEIANGAKPRLQELQVLRETRKEAFAQLEKHLDDLLAR